MGDTQDVGGRLGSSLINVVLEVLLAVLSEHVLEG